MVSITDIVWNSENRHRAKAIYIKKGAEPLFYLALVYAALGEKDKAIDLLDQAYENRSGALINLRTFPFLRNLQGDPRFEELVWKMGFPEVPGPKRD